MVPNNQSNMSVEEVAMGFIRVANEAMCRPIRALTQVFYYKTLWDLKIFDSLKPKHTVFRNFCCLQTEQAKGHDTSQHVLACFGGAGGQHACAIARALGMKTVFIHK